MLRELKSPQRMSRVLMFQIDGSAVAGGTDTTDGITEGAAHATITENGSGDYTITFNQPFARTPTVVVTPVTDVTTCRIKAVTNELVTIEQVGADQTTPEADGDFHVVVFGNDVADQY